VAYRLDSSGEHPSDPTQARLLAGSERPCDAHLVTSDTTHPSLLSRVCDARDETAWREFEARYRDLIRRYARQRGLQAADAEDVSQLVLLALLRALPRFRLDPARGRFRDYLGRIARNAINRHVSRPREPLPLLETSVLESLAVCDGEVVEPTWNDEWTQHHFRLAMRCVEAEFKPASLAIFERLLAGESVAEVARACATTPEAVHKVKQRVGERLKAVIEGQVRDEELDDPAPGPGEEAARPCP
jgi:RNA polymerase sigma-70 factor (ECF subfamily)